MWQEKSLIHKTYVYKNHTQFPDFMEIYQFIQKT